MARKPTARSEYVLFNVYYEDGTRRFEEQDREISGKSGMPPLRIARIVRVDDDVKQQARDIRRANERRASR